VSAVPRYEKGSAFRELALDGVQVVSRSGTSDRDAVEERTSYEGPARARWEYDRQVALAIGEGYRLAAAEPEPAGEVLGELVAAIRDDPGGVETYLVYADWLQARGDPRGELICVQHAIAEQRRLGRTQHEKLFGARALQLDRAEQLLLLLQRERWYGPVLSQVHDVHAQRYVIDLFELEWHLGFLRRAALEQSPRRFELETPLWRALLACDSAAFLREIRLDWADGDQLLEGLPVTLARLEIVLDSWWPPEREQETHVADFGRRSLDGLLPPADFVDAVLERLVPLWRAAAPGRLRELALEGCPFGGRLLAALLELPLPRQLEALELPRCRLTDEDLPLLLGAGEQLGHLRRLDLRRNRFGREGRTRLRGLGPFVVVDG
jgi:uncharacterized protein (TIGR02996 family)